MYDKYYHFVLKIMINVRELSTVTDKTSLNVLVLGSHLFATSFLTSQLINNATINIDIDKYFLRKNKKTLDTAFQTNDKSLKIFEAKIDANIYILSEIKSNINQLILNVDVIVYETNDNEMNKNNLEHIKNKIKEKQRKNEYIRLILISRNSKDKNNYVKAIFELIYLASTIHDNRAELSYNNIISQLDIILNISKDNSDKKNYYNLISKNLSYIFSSIDIINGKLKFRVSTKYHELLLTYVIDLFINAPIEYYVLKHVLLKLINKIIYVYNNILISGIDISSYIVLLNEKVKIFDEHIIKYLFNGTKVNFRYAIILGEFIIEKELYELANKILSKGNMMFIISVVNTYKNVNIRFPFNRFTYDSEYVMKYSVLKK